MRQPAARISPADTTRAVGASPRPRTVAYSSEEILAAKHKFMECARLVCPSFTVRPDHRRALDALCRWALRDSLSPLDPDKGLWLWGNIGTGKSTMLGIVRSFASAVRPTGPDGWKYSFGIFHATEICADFQQLGYERLDRYVRSNRLAIDDLGTETIPTMHYGEAVNVMEQLLLRRYDRRHEAFTHVTTNLAPAQIAQLYGDRVWDRCKELFNFVELPGRTFRQGGPVAGV